MVPPASDECPEACLIATQPLRSRVDTMAHLLQSVWRVRTSLPPAGGPESPSETENQLALLPCPLACKNSRPRPSVPARAPLPGVTPHRIKILASRGRAAIPRRESLQQRKPPNNWPSGASPSASRPHSPGRPRPSGGRRPGHPPPPPPTPTACAGTGAWRDARCAIYTPPSPARRSLLFALAWFRADLY